jgi:hypothetical protein
MTTTVVIILINFTTSIYQFQKIQPIGATDPLLHSKRSLTPNPMVHSSPSPSRSSYLLPCFIGCYLFRSTPSKQPTHSPPDTPTTPFALNRALTSCHRQSPAISILELSIIDPSKTTGTYVFVTVGRSHRSLSDRSLRVLGMQVPWSCCNLPFPTPGPRHRDTVRPGIVKREPHPQAPIASWSLY